MLVKYATFNAYLAYMRVCVPRDEILVTKAVNVELVSDLSRLLSEWLFEDDGKGVGIVQHYSPSM